MVSQIITRKYNFSGNLRQRQTRLTPSQLQQAILNIKNNDVGQIIQIDKLWLSKLKPFMKYTLAKGDWFQIKEKYANLIESLLTQIQEILNASPKLLTILMPHYKKMKALFNALIKRQTLGMKKKQVQKSETISEKRKTRSRKLQQCTDHRIFEQNEKKKQLLINYIYSDKIRRQNDQNQNLGTSKQKTIKQVIYQKQYYQDPRYQQLFRKFERAEARKQSKIYRISKKQNFRENFIKDIHYQKHSPIDYLCCSSFFYQNQPIFNRSIDQFCDISVYESTKDINQNRIRQCFISFLNGSGGLLLFDVGGQSSEVRVKGAKFTESKKQQYQQKIQSFLKDKISPKITNNIDYFFQWVPVIQDPLSYKRQYISQETDSVLSGISLKSKNQKKIRTFVDGQFVLRIRVFPSQPDIIYHQELESGEYIYVRRQGKPVMLSASQIRDFMIKRFRQNSKKVIQHHHQFYPIGRPEQGQRLFQEGTSLKATGPGLKQQTKFKFFSLLVIDKSNKSEVEKALAKQKIENIIYQSFTNYNFRLTSSTYIIQHNQRFDRIRPIIQKIKRKRNGSEFARMISTMTTLEVQKRLPSDQIANLQCWLMNRFPQEKLQLVECNRKQYLITQTNIGAIFLYFLLDNYQFKTKFRKIPEQNNGQRNNSQTNYQSQMQMIYGNMYANGHYFNKYK